MKTTQLFNALNGAIATRNELQEIVDVAKNENNIDVIFRISKALNDNPDDDKFEITNTPINSNRLNAPRHTGSYKEALDECGRLKKGWKFTNGKVVKVSDNLTKKESELKKEILLLKVKYNFSIPKITRGLNGVFLADGHEILTEDETFYEPETGLNASAKEVEQIVNELILEKIKTGEKLPAWKQSWAVKTSVLAQNFETKKEYSGSNAIILNVLLGSMMPTPYYLTATQIDKMGGSIKKGSKSVPLVYYNFVHYIKDFSNNKELESQLLKKINGYEIKRKNKPTITINASNYANLQVTDNEIEYLGLDRNEYLSKGFLRYYRVFNIADTTGIEYDLPKHKEKTEVERIAIAEKIIKGFKDSPPIVQGKDATYNQTRDVITVPDIADFSPKEEYYTTLFHEMIHSTMHEKRLNRIEKYKGKDKDSEYAFEELIAELGACYLAGVSGIINVVYMNSASYLKNWHEKLQKYTETYSDFFVFATKEAQKAVDYILQGFNDSNNDHSKQFSDKEKALAKAKGLKLKLKLKLK